jgi:hypothetical protein
MMMASLLLLMRRCPCRHQDGVISLITMVLSPLIHGGVVVLIVIALLPSSSWHCCPHCNGFIVIIDVIPLVACWQAGIAAINAQASLPLSRWQLLLSSQWHHHRC